MKGGGGASAALEAEQVGLKVFYTFWVQRAEGVTDASSWGGTKLQKHLEGPSE